jgi:thioredoxin-like negative regulator of GroEL
MTTPAEDRADPAPVEKPILLFFTARRDGRSRRADGFLAQVLQRRRNHDQFSLRRIELEDRPDLVERFRVTTLPSLVVIEDKRVRGRLVNPAGAAAIRTFLEPWLR